MEKVTVRAQAINNGNKERGQTEAIQAAPLLRLQKLEPPRRLSEVGSWNKDEALSGPAGAPVA